MHETIEEGDQVFLKDGGEEVGAVRQVRVKEREIVVNVENAGDFVVKGDAIRAVHSGKVILAFDRLDASLRRAVEHAHDQEDR